LAYQLCFLNKKLVMGKENKGQPSATNKSEGTGLSADMQNQDLEKDKEMTDKYIKDEDEISDNVRQEDPNRNVDKGDATNAGGYKN
jgi:hypothetical protein